MPRPEPTAQDKQRLQRLDRTVRELDATEKKADQLRGQRNVLIYQIADSRILGAAAIAVKAKVGESFVYRCLSDRGKPKTGASR